MKILMQVLLFGLQLLGHFPANTGISLNGEEEYVKQVINLYWLKNYITL